MYYYSFQHLIIFNIKLYLESLQLHSSRYLWTVRDYSCCNTDEKNNSPMIDINQQVLSPETRKSISLLSTWWCSKPLLTPHHNSSFVPEESGVILKWSHVPLQQRQSSKLATMHFTFLCCKLLSISPLYFS